MVFGYSTNAFTKFSLPEALDKIAALGFGGVEIMCDSPHLYPPEYTPEDLAALGRQLTALNLKVTNLNSFTLFAVGDTYLPSWIEPEAHRREIRIRHTLASLHVAKALGCANISIPPGGPLDGMDRKTAMALFHKGIERVAPEAEALGIRLLVEPEPDLLLENTAEFMEFISAVRSPWVGINFDIGHFFCAGEDPRSAFETLFEWVGHVHIEDIAPTREHRHLIPGLGAIDFAGVFEAMVRLNYTGDISLELYPYVDMPEAAGRESLAHLRPIFEATGLPVTG